MYEECVKCEKIGKTCDGPNFIAMNAHEVLEWCKLRKAYLGWTNQRIADIAGMPKGTIDRLMAAGEDIDYKYVTIRPIVRALVGGEWQGQPCPDPNAEDTAQDLERLRDEHERITLALAEEKSKHARRMAELKEDADKKVNYLKNEVAELKEDVKRSRVFTIIVSAILAIVVIFDALNPAFGWFQR